MRGPIALAAVLAVALIGSCVATVYAHHERRALFVRLERLESARDALQVEWGRLQLERSTWAANDRVERIARDRLGLVTPSPGDIVLVVP